MGRRKKTSVVRSVPIDENGAVDYAQAARDVIDNRIVDDTKYGYGKKVETMKRWFAEEYPEERAEIFILDNGPTSEFQLPMSIPKILNFFGYMGTKFERFALIEEVTEDMQAPVSEQGRKKKGGKSEKRREAYSVSYVRGFKSALLWYHEQRSLILGQKIELQPDCNAALEKFLQGYQRKIQSLKAAGLKELHEGKNRLLFVGFGILAYALMLIAPTITIKESTSGKKGGGRKMHPHREGNWMQGVFAWCFFTLAWVMMCRSVTTAEILLSSMRWIDDCICIDVAKEKSDQVGERQFPRHIYANPINPRICPILALAVYIFCIYIGNLADTNQPLFPGDFQEDRFSKVLQCALENLPEHLLNLLGGDAADIGTHSTRKGAASYVLSHVGGPNVIQVFLRCCWSLGNVQNRYIFLDAGGDQFVGRTVGGLTMTDSSFATLPPRLRPEDHAEICKMGWELVLPGFDRLCASFQSIVPYLFASITYHADFLAPEFSPQHPIFQTTVFTSGLVDKFKGRILVGEGKCNLTGLLFSCVSVNFNGHGRGNSE